MADQTIPIKLWRLEPDPDNPLRVASQEMHELSTTRKYQYAPNTERTIAIRVLKQALEACITEENEGDIHRILRCYNEMEMDW